MAQSEMAGTALMKNVAGVTSEAAVSYYIPSAYLFLDTCVIRRDSFRQPLQPRHTESAAQTYKK